MTEIKGCLNQMSAMGCQRACVIVCACQFVNDISEINLNQACELIELFVLAVR